MIKKVTIFILFLIFSFVFAKIVIPHYSDLEHDLHWVKSDIIKLKEQQITNTQAEYKLQKLEQEQTKIQTSLNTLFTFSVIIYIFCILLYLNFVGRIYDKITNFFAKLYNKHKGKLTTKNYLVCLATIAVICLVIITYILMFSGKYHHRFFRF